MQTPTELVNFYLNHPPFEVSDLSKYQEVLMNALEQTLRELSEISPVLHEYTKDIPASSNTYELYNIFDIIDPVDGANRNFMGFIILTDINNTPIINKLANFLNMNVRKIQKYCLQASLLYDTMLLDNYMLLEDYFTFFIKKIIFDNNKVKLKTGTTYYMLYKKYKTLNDIMPSEMNDFQELLNINLLLYLYNSDIFSSEGGIRSVSLSGLSVSFNVPNAETFVRQLSNRKKEIISTLSIDYSDIGIIA